MSNETRPRAINQFPPSAIWRIYYIDSRIEVMDLDYELFPIENEIAQVLPKIIFLS